MFVSLMGFLNFGNYWVQHNWPRPVMLSEHKDLQKDLWKVELEHRILKKRWLQTVLSEIDRDITRLEADKKVSASTLLDQKNQIVDEIEDLQRRISELQKLVGS